MVKGLNCRCRCSRAGFCAIGRCGVGWVSFYREDFLRTLVGMPEQVRPVAWLCVGPVTDLPEVPDLERFGWRARSSLETVLHTERYGG